MVPVVKSAKKEPVEKKKPPPAKKTPAKAKQAPGVDLFSAPQHFTASGSKSSPKAKMKRIPKITEKVSLPSPSSLGLLGNPLIPGANPLIPGVNPLLPGANPLLPGSSPLIPGANPLIPNPLMNFYGFPGGMPGAASSLIPGLNPGLLGQMAMMQQVLVVLNVHIFFNSCCCSHCWYEC